MAALAALTMAGPGCSLGNVSQDDCTSTEECVAAFGAGSLCEDGYCTDGGGCVTGHDCRAVFGGGACVNGKCTETYPVDATCVTEPEDLYQRPATGEDGLVVLGGIFSLELPFDTALTNAVRLGVRDINRNGGGVDGKKYGVIFCDNGGPAGKTEGEAREALNRHALDYLAGTIGVPMIVGPLSSRDADTLINHEVASGYPTVLISPSATSPALSAPIDKLSPDDPFGMFWRTCPSDKLQGAVLGEYVADDELINKVTVLYLQDQYGEGLAQVFKASFPRTTNLVPFDALEPEEDLSGYVADVEASDPDAIVIIAVKAEDTVAFLKAMVGTSLTSAKFFFTDGSKDKAQLLDPDEMDLGTEVVSIIQNAKGTAPALPQGQNYDLFAINLGTEFDLDASGFAFLAQSYDATFIGAWGTVYAEATNPAYDGRLVAEGLSRLIAGPEVNVIPTEWSAGKGAFLGGDRQFNVRGTSGELDFDPAVGEAPAPIEIWYVLPNRSGFDTETTVTP